MATSDPIPTHADDASRWEGVERPYDAEAVEKLRGSLPVEHTLARHGAEKLWKLLHERDYVAALGASTGNQAVQQVTAGLEAIYLSGWQVAADANIARQMYPDQGLYPVNSVPEVVRGINAALQRADQIDHAEGKDDIDWFVPIVADARGRASAAHLNVFELTKAMIDAGAAGVHFEDQLASEKKCGHMGGKVLVPTSWAIRNLVAARLAADVSGMPTLIVARTDADAADMVTSDVDERDHEFLTGERTEEGFFRSEAGIEQAIARGIAYAPYADLVWCETSEPDLEQARALRRRRSTTSTRASCSPTTARRRFNWKSKLDDDDDRRVPAASWGRWATASSSSRWPASTRSTTRCSSSPAATATTA